LLRQAFAQAGQGGVQRPLARRRGILARRAPATLPGAADPWQVAHGATVDRACTADRACPVAARTPDPGRSRRVRPSAPCPLQFSSTALPRTRVVARRTSAAVAPAMTSGVEPGLRCSNGPRRTSEASMKLLLT